MAENNYTTTLALPPSINGSTILSDNDKNLLASLAEMPTINPSYNDDVLKNIIQYYSISPDEMEKELHIHAKALLAQQKIQDAWQVLLAGI